MSRTWKSAPVVVLASALMCVGTAPARAGSTTHADAQQAVTSEGEGSDVANTDWGDDDTKEGRQATSGGVWDPAADIGSIYSLTRTIGA